MKGINMKDQFGRNLTDNAELALFRIADAIEEILRLVREDMKEIIKEGWDVFPPWLLA